MQKNCSIRKYVWIINRGTHFFLNVISFLTRLSNKEFSDKYSKEDKKTRCRNDPILKPLIFMIFDRCGENGSSHYVICPKTLHRFSKLTLASGHQLPRWRWCILPATHRQKSSTIVDLKIWPRPKSSNWSRRQKVMRSFLNIRQTTKCLIGLRHLNWLLLLGKPEVFARIPIPAPGLVHRYPLFHIRMINELPVM